MFTRGKRFRREWIDSDEGFSIALGRDTLVYREGKRRMAITVDMGAGKVVVFTSTIGRWDDNPMSRVSEDERRRITHNIEHALESQGHSVELLA